MTIDFSEKMKIKTHMLCENLIEYFVFEKICESLQSECSTSLPGGNLVDGLPPALSIKNEIFLQLEKIWSNVFVQS